MNSEPETEPKNEVEPVPQNSNDDGRIATSPFPPASHLGHERPTDPSPGDLADDAEGGQVTEVLIGEQSEWEKVMAESKERTDSMAMATNWNWDTNNNQLNRIEAMLRELIARDGRNL